jgi:ubiquitin carboxyl-terminal hydrolase 1
MEYLQDASCRKCSFETTVKALASEIELLKHESKKQKKDTKKKREIVVQLVAMEKAKREIEHRLSVGRIEEENDHDKLPLLRSVSRMSSKQVMLAKPPKILCLHISRSAFLNTGAIYKNTCQILFPEYLDVLPFSTNGTLHTQPNIPISTISTNEDDAAKAGGKRFYYKLMSVVVHYGSHSFGHFVAFKRRIYADQCKCYQCTGNGITVISVNEKAEKWKCQNSWYRISDSKVDECSIEDVKRSNPYMLLYELISEDDLEGEEEEEEWDDDEEGEQEEQEEQEIRFEKEEEDYEENKQDNNTTTTNNNTTYNNIPTDDAAKEALRIATALIMGDQEK